MCDILNQISCVHKDHICFGQYNKKTDHSAGTYSFFFSCLSEKSLIQSRIDIFFMAYTLSLPNIETKSAHSAAVHVFDNLFCKSLKD